MRGGASAAQPLDDGDGVRVLGVGGAGAQYRVRATQAGDAVVYGASSGVGRDPQRRLSRGRMDD